MVKKKTSLLEQLKKDREKDDIFSQIYKEIYAECLNCIKNVNSVGNREFVYKVPMFLIGYPLYDINRVITKLTVSLKREGLKTEQVQSDSILIRW